MRKAASGCTSSLCSLFTQRPSWPSRPVLFSFHPLYPHELWAQLLGVLHLGVVAVRSRLLPLGLNPSFCCITG